MNDNNQWVDNLQNQQFQANNHNMKQKKDSKSLIIMILSIINLIALLFLGGIIFFIISIVLLVISILDMKSNDVKAIISLIINIITIVVTIVLFIIAFKKVNNVFDDARSKAFKLQAQSILTEADFINQNTLTGTVLCSNLVNINSKNIKNCSINFDGNEATITIEDSNGYCIYDGTMNNMKVEKCK